ncbi:MAG TPA: hypothetical protein VF331_25700 [Polyangiales bacterium]
MTAWTATSALDPQRFAPGDRFAVLGSCPESLQASWDLVVFQAGEAFFPLQPTAALQCGNRVSLPDAFTLRGEAPDCVALDLHAAIARSELRRRGPAGLPSQSACIVVAPVAP